MNLNIDSKTIKATANTYIVDKNNIARVSYNAFEEVKKDNKALEAMAKMQNKSVEEIKEIFTVDKNENVSDWKDKYALTFYTKGFLNQFLGFAFSINDQKIIEVLVKDEYNVITYCDKDNCIEAEGKIDNLKYVYKVKGKESFSGSIVTYSENSFAITAEMDKLFIAKLTAKLESDDKVTPIDTEKAIDYNSLTEKDKEAINEKLVNTILNSESLTKLIMLINSEEESQNL